MAPTACTASSSRTCWSHCRSAGWSSRTCSAAGNKFPPDRRAETRRVLHAARARRQRRRRTHAKGVPALVAWTSRPLVSMPMTRHGWLSAGLFLTTLATLLVEILDSRLLSVLTWYHLSFFAVSLAMLGMAAGAVFVFLGGSRFAGDRAASALRRTSLWLAVAVPISHIFNLVIPLPSLSQASTMAIAAMAASTVVLTVPFLLSGIIVTVALTRAGGRIGRLYGWDLVGAAIGALLVVPLLDRFNLSSVFFLAGAVAAAGAFAFAQFEVRAVHDAGPKG